MGGKRDNKNWNRVKGIRDIKGDRRKKARNRAEQKKTGKKEKKGRLGVGRAGATARGERQDAISRLWMMTKEKKMKKEPTDQTDLSRIS
ncbi:hypothetical protein HL42_1671 [Trichophyton rubrum]|nr:hypothetical protein HL42_1671 [Trichophyton rubrum]